MAAIVARLRREQPLRNLPLPYFCPQCGKRERVKIQRPSPFEWATWACPTCWQAVFRHPFTVRLGQTAAYSFYIRGKAADDAEVKGSLLYAILKALAPLPKRATPATGGCPLPLPEWVAALDLPVQQSRLLQPTEAPARANAAAAAEDDDDDDTVSQPPSSAAFQEIGDQPPSPGEYDDDEEHDDEEEDEDDEDLVIFEDEQEEADVVGRLPPPAELGNQPPSPPEHRRRLSDTPCTDRQDRPRLPPLHVRHYQPPSLPENAVRRRRPSDTPPPVRQIRPRLPPRQRRCRYRTELERLTDYLTPNFIPRDNRRRL